MSLQSFHERTSNCHLGIGIGIGNRTSNWLHFFPTLMALQQFFQIHMNSIVFKGRMKIWKRFAGRSDQVKPTSRALFRLKGHNSHAQESYFSPALPL